MGMEWTYFLYLWSRRWRLALRSRSFWFSAFQYSMDAWFRREMLGAVRRGGAAIDCIDASPERQDGERGVLGIDRSDNRMDD